MVLITAASSVRLPGSSAATCQSSRRVFVLAGMTAAMRVRAASAASSLGYVDDAGGERLRLYVYNYTFACSHTTPLSVCFRCCAVKSYSQVQRAWEKSAGMSDREIRMTARGAGKVDDPSTESDRSRKRRAM